MFKYPMIGTKVRGWLSPNVAKRLMIHCTP